MAPMPTERNGFTLGMTVLKLLAAMNDEKQAPGNAARVNPIITIAKKLSGSFVASAAVIERGVSFDHSRRPGTRPRRSPRFPRSE